VNFGVGEVVVNSIDADGTKQGFEIELTSMIHTGEYTIPQIKHELVEAAIPIRQK